MINIIVAIGVNNLIGKNNDLPWHYKEDLQYFKEVTMNKTVIMGEQTFYSIVLSSKANLLVKYSYKFGSKILLKTFAVKV